MAAEPRPEDHPGSAGRRPACHAGAGRPVAARPEGYASPACRRFAELAAGAGLLRHPLAAAGQALAFGLILLAMALIALLRGELLDTAGPVAGRRTQPFRTQRLACRKGCLRRANRRTLQPCRATVSGGAGPTRGDQWRAGPPAGQQGVPGRTRDSSRSQPDPSADLPKDNHLVAGQWWHERAEAELPACPSRPNWPKACS